MKILSYILGDRTGKQYYNGYSSRNVVIQVDEDKLGIIQAEKAPPSTNIQNFAYIQYFFAKEKYDFQANRLLIFKIVFF